MSIRTLLVLLTIVIAAAVAAYVVIAMQRTETPQRQRLCAISNDVQKVSFNVPKGSHFNLLIGTAGDQEDRQGRGSILGSIIIVVGTNEIADISFDSVSLTRANWLSAFGLNAFILTWPLGSQPLDLDRHFAPGVVDYCRCFQSSGFRCRCGDCWRDNNA